MTHWFSSLSFFNIAGLFGLISLLIPLIIHLIHRSRGKLVYVGNIDFVKQAKKIRVTEIKLTQWILLFIRLLIFLVLSFIISELTTETETKNLAKTHIYFSKNWLTTASLDDFRNIKKKQPAANFFLLSPGFPAITEETLDAQPEASINTYAAVVEISQLPVQAEQTIVYASNTLNQYSQIKPQLSNQINWVIEPFIKKNGPNPPIEVNVYSDTSRAYDKETIGIVFEQLNKKYSNVFVVRYFNIESLQVMPESDWVLWLSEKPVANKILDFVKEGGFLLTDQKTDKTRSNKVIKLAQIEGVDIEFVTDEYKQSIEVGDYLSQTLWYDNTQLKLLERHSIGKGQIYQFHGRFNPSLTNFVEKKEFPTIIAQILFSINPSFENKVISESEITTSIDDFENFKIMHYESMHRWLILFVSILWLFERWLAEKRRGVNE